MTMENNQEKYVDLIVKYLSDECTGGEKKILEAWME